MSLAGFMVNSLSILIPALGILGLGCSGIARRLAASSFLDVKKIGFGVGQGLLFCPSQFRAVPGAPIYLAKWSITELDADRIWIYSRPNLLNSSPFKMVRGYLDHSGQGGNNVIGDILR